jgi:hypothetical protein
MTGIQLGNVTMVASTATAKPIRWTLDMTNCTRDVGASPLLYLRAVANLPRFFCSKVEVIVVQVRILTGCARKVSLALRPVNNTSCANR